MATAKKSKAVAGSTGEPATKPATPPDAGSAGGESAQGSTAAALSSPASAGIDAPAVTIDAPAVTVTGAVVIDDAASGDNSADVQDHPATAPSGAEQAVSSKATEAHDGEFDQGIFVPSFPRLVAIVNDTPIPYVIGARYVVGHHSEPALVNSEDDITRLKSDCEQIIKLNPEYRGQGTDALRVVEVENAKDD